MFSKRLKELRTQKGIYQKELAEVLGVSRPTITQYEQGKRNPDTDMLNNIADYFEVSVDYLLGRTNKKNEMAKLEKIAPKGTLELLNEEELEFLLEIANDNQRQVLLRESRGLTDSDLAKAIKIIKAFAEEEDK
ncbi:DNA-binding XRE family transcriptional regulator [Orenia metallireducens]|uniref:DNA-binding transcriptional regulator, XRE-family HTH domain n=1 Tax=Orenia metallireducens TaxID=1413210 RepID=A0A285IJ39_9FIRM|nr:helix-turn-helix transcriptional regulator [Orenia metallireducens]PRX29373.1 DNA-binding XRE family transcriptional regulator [Orenia metallireducens]SNY47999.1 DNA-binding transcriptional regulator, XRE-family HTH domain [Orenia metallireducens]